MSSLRRSGVEVWATVKLLLKEADAGQIANEEVTLTRGSLHWTPLSSGLVVAQYPPWVAARRTLPHFSVVVGVYKRRLIRWPASWVGLRASSARLACPMSLQVYAHFLVIKTTMCLSRTCKSWSYRGLWLLKSSRRRSKRLRWYMHGLANIFAGL